MPTWNDVLAPTPDVVTQESEGELVVVLPHVGKFLVLNPTGALMFYLSDGSRTLRDVAQQIAEEYEADPSQVESDVLKLAQSLIERGVLMSVKQETA